MGSSFRGGTRGVAREAVQRLSLPSVEGRERAVLVAGLAARGIDVLQPGADVGAGELNDRDLIAGLAASTDPRLRNALALLFIRRPELAAEVQPVVALLPEPAADVLRQQYSAAVYLDRRWFTRLRVYLPDRPPLPDLFGERLALPSPDERFGLTGLLALQARVGFNLMASYDTLMTLLFDQLRRERVREPASHSARSNGGARRTSTTS
jgi:hypothetical protein